MRRLKKSKSVWLMTAAIFSCFAVPGHSNTYLSADDELLDQSLETLSQIIISASKREESLLDAPMSASVLTAAQIRHSGALTIPEALRMVSGVIVREQANGVYDVHIRGLDNAPEGSVVRYAANSLTLVMIDNRIVFNHYTGGTPWQSLPISLIDVERIEVVRGAAAALYGPNAVTGVIHIFTKDPRATRDKFTAQAQAGTEDTYLAAGDSGFALGENWSGRISANGQHRSRHDASYYDWFDASYEKNPAALNDTASFPVPGAALTQAVTLYPDPSLAIERRGVNLSLAGNLDDGQKLDIALGYLESRNQEIFNDNAATPFTTVERENFYLNTQADLGIWNAHFDYAKSSENNLGPDYFSFDSQTMRVGVDANYVFGSWTLQPLLDYSWREYSGYLFMGEKESIEESAAGLRTEYQWRDTRLYAAVRGSDYDFSSDTDWSWIGGLTHKLTKELVLRASYGRAYQEPFMVYTFQNLMFPGLLVLGNEDLDRVYVDSAELGLRWQIDRHWSVDAAVFDNHSKDLQLVYFNGQTQMINAVPFAVVQYQNVPTEAEQLGATAQLMYQNNVWRASVFFNVQDTDLSDQLYIDASYQNRGQYDADHKNTPEMYGGFSLNYTGFQRWVVDVSGYWMDASQQINQYARSYPDNVPNGKVDAKFIMNSKISWLMSDEVTLFLNVRNLGDDQSQEFAYADSTGAVYLLGIEWKN